MAERDKSRKDPAKTTPPKWSQYEDARKNKKSGKYPNYWVRKTRSGHTFIFDDSEGAEHITLQHRSGSMIQMMPDGAVQYVSHNGKQEIVFGENRITITGAQDVTINGDCSMKVKGNYNATIDGDANMTVAGNYALVAKSKNEVIAEHADMMAQTESKKITNDSTTEVGGAYSMTADFGASLVSKGDGITMDGQTFAVVRGGQGAVLESGADASIKAGGTVGIDGADTYIQSGRAKKANQVGIHKPSPAPSKMGGSDVPVS